MNVGDRVGSYEVLAKLGEGGMGQVYRARDARLGRDVAVKALPDAFAEDRERLTRFEREARLLASLNHPNLGVLYGLEREGNRLYLALELVEGESLAQRLARGALPLAEACDIAAQVAAGLEAAHQAGIVHRDLKPANVMVRPDGIVKILDFGLAREAETPASGSDLSNSPTMTSPATAAGVILGTAAYMSPEQARGRFVDRRSDLWAWGCLFYECLTAKRAFPGDNLSDTLAAIIKSDPDWTALPANTPPRVRELIARCLRKDPRERLRDAGDARLLLLDAMAPSDVPSAARPRSRAVLWIPVGAALVVAAAVLGYMLRRPIASAAPPPLTTSVRLPEGVTIGGNTIETAVSPDGRRIAVAAADDSGTTKIWIRELARDDIRALPGTEAGAQPFWSPDGTRLGFFAGGKLKTMALASGSIDELCDAPLPRGAAWGDGVIVLQPRSTGPLVRIPDRGGSPVETTVVAKGQNATHRFPSFLPDGRHFIYAVTPGRDYINDIELGSIEGGPGRKTERASAGAVYAAPGYLVFFRDGAMRARRFDPGTMTASGPALALPGLGFVGLNADGAAMVSASATGVIVQPALVDLPAHLVWIDRHGVSSESHQPDGFRTHGSMAPDGRRAAYEMADHPWEPPMIWVLDLVRGTSQRMTFEGANTAPVWSPDGREIAFAHQAGQSNRDLWTMRADTPGSGRLTVPTSNVFNTVISFAPDGKSFVYRTQGSETQQDIMLATLGDSPSTRPLLATRFNELYGVISPDGRWMAYLSDESGGFEVYVRSFPSLSGQVRVSTGGASNFGATNISGIGRPIWRRDGRELIYVARDGRTILSVDVHRGNPADFGQPRALFTLPPGVIDMVAAPDLDRFLVTIDRQSTERLSISTIVNWPSLLETAK